MSHPIMESTPPPPPAPSSPFASPDQPSIQTESAESAVRVSFTLDDHPSGIVSYAELVRQRQLRQQQPHVHEHEHWQPHSHANTHAHTTDTQELGCQKGFDIPMTDVSKVASLTSTSTSTSISTLVSTSVSEPSVSVSAPYANGSVSQRVWIQSSLNRGEAQDNNSGCNSNGDADIGGGDSKNITGLGCSTSAGKEEAEVHDEEPSEQHAAAAEHERQYHQNTHLQYTYLQNQSRYTDMHIGQKREQQQLYPTQVQAQEQSQGDMDRAAKDGQDQADVGSAASNNKIEEKCSPSRSNHDNAAVVQCGIVGPKVTKADGMKCKTSGTRKALPEMANALKYEG